LVFIPWLLPAQSPDWDQKVDFAKKVRTVKYWIYIEGDRKFTSYAEASEALIVSLEKKGFSCERLYYEPGEGQTIEEWRSKIVKSLSESEAFLEVRHGIISDTLGSLPGRNTVMVQDASGRVYAQHSLTEPAYQERVEYRSFADAELYIRPKDEKPVVPWYSRRSGTHNAAVDQAVTSSLRGIPRSTNRHRETVWEHSNYRLWMDLAAYGGYCGRSGMDVTGGEAYFAAGPVYGLEFLFRIIKGVYVSAGYEREDSFMTVDVPDNPKQGEIAISSNYILMGGIVRFFEEKTFKPYLGIDIGPVNLVPKDKFYRDVWYFAAGGRAGVLCSLGNIIDLRLQLQFICQIHPKNAPFLYSDYIRDMGKPVNAYSNLPLGDVTFGIVFHLMK
jgi:hypothetical protein